MSSETNLIESSGNNNKVEIKTDCNDAKAIGTSESANNNNLDTEKAEEPKNDGSINAEMNEAQKKTETVNVLARNEADEFSDQKNKKEMQDKTEPQDVEASDGTQAEDKAKKPSSEESIGTKSEMTTIATSNQSEEKTAPVPAEETKSEKSIAQEENNQKSETKNVTSTQGGLPKWMVEDANAPLSPSPDAEEKQTDEQQQNKASETPQKGRGRGRPAGAKKASQEQSSSQALEQSNIPLRPRRSTRTRIDYANPDAVTVLAEVDDEEPAGANKKNKKEAQVRKAMPSKGRKRKTTGTSEDARDDDDDDEDYGSKHRKKRTAAKTSISPAKRGRGRPAGNKNNSGSRGKAALGRRKRGRNQQYNESDDEGEVVYDDRESEKEPTSDEGEFDEGIPASKKAKTIIEVKPPSGKKRGRPPGRRHVQATAAGEKVAKSELPSKRNDVNEESDAKQSNMETNKA